MKKILFIGLLCIGCTKPKTEIAQSPFAHIAFHNLTTMEFNYSDGCEANIVTTGSTNYLTCGADTICSFKVDAMGTLSWKATQGHSVSFGGCNMTSLTINQ